MDYMTNWFSDRTEKYKILVAEVDHCVVGWVSLNPYLTGPHTRMLLIYLFITIEIIEEKV
ncbi:hypothetical protein C7H81_14585 [Bacillus subtilis]|nr:hypothetical protein CVV77_16225 [Bacillus sp. SN1]PSI04589.1 hypothetical protein C7H81_14585 [Bacillus subtilis]